MLGQALQYYLRIATVNDQYFLYHWVDNMPYYDKLTIHHLGIIVAPDLTAFCSPVSSFFYVDASVMTVKAICISCHLSTAGILLHRETANRTIRLHSLYQRLMLEPAVSVGFLDQWPDQLFAVKFWQAVSILVGVL